MRYRRLSYRYVVLEPRGPDQLGSPWASLPARLQLARPQWRPRSDVYESPGEISLIVDLAGVDPDDIDIELFEDAVIIEGARRLAPPDGSGPGCYRSVEIPRGPFRVEVRFESAIDADTVQARYESGLLHVTLPKRAAE